MDKFAPRKSIHPAGDVTEAMNIVRRNFYERNLKKYDLKRIKRKRKYRPIFHLEEVMRNM